MCDAPARAYLKSICGHSGKYGRERCTQEGDHDGLRVIYETKASHPRSEESFRRQDDESHHEGTSPLTRLPTNFIAQFLLDPMHLIYHGVLIRFLLYVIGKDVTNAKIKGRDIAQISSNLESVAGYRTKEFARPPRPLTFVGRWKATELRFFLLYVGVVVLSDVLIEEKKPLYEYFLQLHVAVGILSCPSLVGNADYVNFAENLLAVFVGGCTNKSMFGPGFVTYNVHSMLHLCDDVRRFGNIMNFSVFVFENYMGILKGMIRSGVKVAQRQGVYWRWNQLMMSALDGSQQTSGLLVMMKYLERTQSFPVNHSL